MTTMYTIRYSDHDIGAGGGEFDRETLADAQAARELLRQCGYTTISVVEYVVADQESR